MPDVVAVVPARNEAAYVARSLRSLLAQDYGGRLGVILVDDQQRGRDKDDRAGHAQPAGPVARGDRRATAAAGLVGQAVGGV